MLKTVYVLGVALIIFVATIESARRHDSRAVPPLNLVYASSLVFVGIVAMSTLAGVLGGTSPLDALRDGFPYVLLAASPILALDLASGFGIGALRTWLATVGLLAGVSFTLSWLSRRGLSGIDVNRALLASFMLCGATVSYAAARVINGERRNRTVWFGIACVISVLVLITGTRSALLFALVPATALMVTTQASFARRIGYAIVGLVGGAVAVVAFAFVFTALFDVNRSELRDRLTSVPGFSTNRLSHQSLDERDSQRRAVRAIWSEHPLVGAGAGTKVTWVDASGSERSSITSDTLLAFPAKLGAAGVAALLVWMWAIARLARTRRRFGAVVAADALTVLAVLAGFYGYLASPLEDKGLAFGLVLIIGLLMVESRDVDASNAVTRMTHAPRAGNDLAQVRAQNG